MRWLLLASLTLGLPASAQLLNLLGGPTAGLTSISAQNISSGPSYGASLEWTLRAQWALTLAFDRSNHTAELFEGRVTVPARMSMATVGWVYRVDLTPIVPYFGVNGQSRWFKLDQYDTDQDYTASLAVGLLVPVLDHFFVSGEARYGLYSESELGNARTYLFRLGARVGLL